MQRLGEDTLRQNINITRLLRELLDSVLITIIGVADPALHRSARRCGLPGAVAAVRMSRAEPCFKILGILGSAKSAHTAVSDGAGILSSRLNHLTIPAKPAGQSRLRGGFDECQHVRGVRVTPGESRQPR